MPKTRARRNINMTAPVDDLTVFPASPFDVGASIPPDLLVRDDGAKLIGIEPVLDLVATYVVSNETRPPAYAPYGAPVSRKRRKGDDCCDNAPQPAKAVVEGAGPVGKDLIVKANASHPCGIRRLAIHLATVEYKPKPGGRVRERLLTKVDNSGDEKTFDCPSTESKRVYVLKIPLTRVRDLGLAGVPICAVAVAESCCYTEDQGMDGLGIASSKDFTV